MAINRNFSLKAGFQATYLQKKVDWSKLTFGDMIDPRRGFIYNTDEIPITEGVNTVDFSAGLLGFSKTYFAGFVVHHITEPNESLTKTPPGSPLPRKYTAHAGAVIPLDGRNGDSNISPNILFQQQQDFQQINFGVYVNKGPIIGGLWYRNKDAFIILVGIQQEMFKFGYSYDITASKLGVDKTFGSHEISFALQFNCRPKKRKFRTISCPSF